MVAGYWPFNDPGLIADVRDSPEHHRPTHGLRHTLVQQVDGQYICGPGGVEQQVCRPRSTRQNDH